MYLFKSWGESLSLFKSGNLKLLLLVTLNSLRRYYKFILAFVILFLACDNNLWRIFFGVKIFFLDFIQIILFLYMPFIFVLVMRPSVKRKSFEYFLDYKWHFVFWLVVPFITIFFIYFGVIFTRDFIYWIFNFNSMPIILAISALFIILPSKIIETFLALFWLDSRHNFKQMFLSLWYAIKMFVFNLPLYFILVAIPYLGFMFLMRYFLFIFGEYWPIFITYYLLIFYIFYTCFLVNFYTKNIHDKFSVYFGE